MPGDRRMYVMVGEEDSHPTRGDHAEASGLGQIISDRLREADTSGSTVPLVIGGPSQLVAASLGRARAAVPADWFGSAMSCLPGQALDEWRDSLSAAIEVWLQTRPGLRALHEAAAILGETGLPAATALARVNRELSDVPGPMLFVEIDDVDPGEPEVERLLSLMGGLQQGGAPVFVIATSPVHPSFAALSSSGADLIEVIDVMPSTTSGCEEAVAALSSDARLYLGALIAEPATHEDLVERLGDDTDLGDGGSNLTQDYTEVRRAGLVRVDADGVLAPSLPDLGSLLG